MWFSLPSLVIGFAAGAGLCGLFGLARADGTDGMDETRGTAIVIPAPLAPPAPPAPLAPLAPPVPSVPATAPEALATQLATELAGEPIPFPSTIAERHAQAALLHAMRSAPEMKLSGDVTAIDCSEDPCLASVRVGEAIDIERLLESPALAAYRGDAPSFAASGFDDDNVLVIGFSERPRLLVEPDDPARDDKMSAFRSASRALHLRRRARVRAMFQAAIDEKADEDIGISK